MFLNNQPKILLITDDAAEESHTAHILSKYHFSNALIRMRKASEASGYFSGDGNGDGKQTEEPPELIILGMGATLGANRILGMESRLGPVKDVPLIIVANQKEEEESIRRLNLPLTACITKPIGFFKLLEAMQKIGMRWIVLKPE